MSPDQIPARNTTSPFASMKGDHVAIRVPDLRPPSAGMWRSSTSAWCVMALRRSEPGLSGARDRR